MLTVLRKSYVAENAPDYGCVSCVVQRETGYGLRGRIRVVFMLLISRQPIYCSFSFILHAFSSFCYFSALKASHIYYMCAQRSQASVSLHSCWAQYDPQRDLQLPSIKRNL